VAFFVAIVERSGDVRYWLTSAFVDARTFLAWDERVKRRGPSTSPTGHYAGNFLFGGCGLASALVALEEASARPTIWATAQYLSYARSARRSPSRPISPSSADT